MVGEQSAEDADAVDDEKVVDAGLLIDADDVAAKGADVVECKV